MIMKRLSYIGKDVAGSRLLHLFLLFALTAVALLALPQQAVAQKTKPVYQTDFSSKDYVDTAAPMIWPTSTGSPFLTMAFLTVLLT